MKPKSGYIYLIQAGDMCRFKIGCATDLDSRLASLQTASPLPLHLLGAFRANDMYAEEHKLHSLFTNSRLIGEWFDLDEKQFISIARKTKAKYVTLPKYRTEGELQIGKIYYISLDGLNAIEVQLIKIEKFNDTDKYDNAIVKEMNGYQSWNVFPDEVRSTKIGALMNCMFVLNSPLVRTP